MVQQPCYYCQKPVSDRAPACPHCGVPLLLRDRYHITGVLGQGGFGIVYGGHDLMLDRRYAIKVISAAMPAHREQVAVEAQILAQHARHLPFMPEIYDIWNDTAKTVLVMEYVDGVTLGQLIERHGAWPPSLAAQFLRTMLGYLEQLHGLGIVHRDIKPDNIKRNTKGRYVLLDFGIAKRTSSTQTAAKAFSLYYAAPEQTRGQATDARSDLYSLGATVYHLITGSPPIPGEARHALAQALLPPSQVVDRVPPVLDQVVMGLLETNPAQRPASATAALKMLMTPPQDYVAAPKAANAAPAVSSAGKATQEVSASSAGKATQAVQPVKQAVATGTVVKPEQPSRSKFLPIIGIVGILALVLGAGWFFLSQKSTATGAVTPTASVQVALASPTVDAIQPSPTLESTATVAVVVEPTVEAATPEPATPTLAEPTAPPASPTAEPPTVPAATALPANKAEIVTIINEQRVINGLPPLNPSDLLMTAAQVQSDDMAANDFFSSTGTDGSDVKVRIDRTGYVSTFWVELISAGNSQPLDVVNSWFQDPNNRSHLLGSQAVDVGIGYSSRAGTQYSHYWTIVLARP